MRKISLLVGLAIAFMVAMLNLSPAESAPNDDTFTVNTQLDAVDAVAGDGFCQTSGGDCTVRAAIQEANAQFAAHPGSMYTITVPGPLPSLDPTRARVYTLTIAGGGEDFAASGDLDIRARMLIRSSNGRPVLINAAGLGDRVFHIIQPPTGTIDVSFIQVSIANGTATLGGGLYIESAAGVTLTSLSVTTNTAQSQLAYGGGIYNGGFSALTLENVTVRSNVAVGGDQGLALGGGIFSTGNVVLNSSAVMSNSAIPSVPTDANFAAGGGIYLACCAESFVLSGSIVSNNQISLGTAATGAQGVGIWANSTVTVVNSTISGNRFFPINSTTHDMRFEGGGMYLVGQLTMLTSTVAGNQLKTNVSSGILEGGGLALAGKSLIAASVITGNSLLSQNTPDGSGGGIAVGNKTLPGDLVLERSVVGSNQSQFGGGFYVHPTSTLAVRDSAIHMNFAAFVGGGIYNLGVLTVTNSIFEGNVSRVDGGGIGNFGIASVESTTFHGNIADLDVDDVGDGGGIAVGGSATLFLRNSLFSGNSDLTTSGPVRQDCSGTVISQDYNLMEQSPAPAPGCNLIGATSHNLHGVFPNVLAPAFQNNGGDTPTRALPAGSAAVNAGDPAGCKDENGNPLTTDQRGFPRLGACDIGAFEFMLRTDLPAIMR